MQLNKHDPIYIKPEWQDEGDDEFNWFAAEDADLEEDGDVVWVYAVHVSKPRQWAIHPTHPVRKHMLDDTPMLLRRQAF